MIELFDQDIRTNAVHSSKGNQLKWKKGSLWYKADYLGYEGLTEYIISELLKKSSLNENELTVYSTEQIRYRSAVYNGCSSRDFLPEGSQLITLERLFVNETGESLYKSVFKIADHEARLTFLVSQVEKYTGLYTFGAYLARLLTLDAVFLNEDRHLHNIAVILNSDGNYSLCPVFDMGAGLLSDTRVDYPVGENIHDMIDSVRSKTICDDFDEQLEIAEKNYGTAVHLHFTGDDVEELLEKEPYYPKEIKTRVADILHAQIRKYQYLFH